FELSRCLLRQILFPAGQFSELGSRRDSASARKRKRGLYRTVPDSVGKGKAFSRGSFGVGTARKQRTVPFDEKTCALPARGGIDDVIGFGVTAGGQNNGHRLPEFV